MWLKQKTTYTCALPSGEKHYGLSYETARKLLLNAGVPDLEIAVYKTGDFYTKEMRQLTSESD